MVLSDRHILRALSPFFWVAELARTGRARLSGDAWRRKRALDPNGHDLPALDPDALSNQIAAFLAPPDDQAPTNNAMLRAIESAATRPGSPVFFK